MLLTLKKENFRYTVRVSALNTFMKLKEFVTEQLTNEQFTATERMRIAKRLDALDSEEAWRLAHSNEEKEFQQLVLDYYDTMRKTQNVLDAKDAAQKMADAQRKRAQYKRKLRESSEKVQEGLFEATTLALRNFNKLSKAK